ncbi:MAG: hypothetical protein JWL84_5996 [Rhodospirillales bacterium]|nr:hypothetical protein [Rhodospirillales bacterium]
MVEMFNVTAPVEREHARPPSAPTRGLGWAHRAHRRSNVAVPFRGRNLDPSKYRCPTRLRLEPPYAPAPRQVRSQPVPADESHAEDKTNDCDAAIHIRLAPVVSVQCNTELVMQIGRNLAWTHSTGRRS